MLISKLNETSGPNNISPIKAVLLVRSLLELLFCCQWSITPTSTFTDITFCFCKLRIVFPSNPFSTFFLLFFFALFLKNDQFLGILSCWGFFSYHLFYWSAHFHHSGACRGTVTLHYIKFAFVLSANIRPGFADQEHRENS